MQKLIVCILLVLLVAVCIDAQRGGRGGRRGGRGGRGGGRGTGGRRPGQNRPNREDIDSYDWTVTVDSDNAVTQKAFVHTEKDVVVMWTTDITRAMNLVRASVGMNTTSGTMAFRLGRTCFLTTISTTTAEVQNQLSIWNTTTINLTSTMSLNGTGAPLNREESKARISDDTFLGPFCRRKRLVDVTSMTDGAEDQGTRTVNFLGYGTQISLIVTQPQRPQRPQRPGGRGGQSGGSPGSQGPRGGRGGRRGGRRGGSRG